MNERESRDFSAFSAGDWSMKLVVNTYRDYFYPVISILFYDGELIIPDLINCIRNKYKVIRERIHHPFDYTESNNFCLDVRYAISKLVDLELVEYGPGHHNRECYITEKGRMILFLIEKLKEPEFTNLAFTWSCIFPEIRQFPEYGDFIGKHPSK